LNPANDPLQFALRLKLVYSTVLADRQLRLQKIGLVLSETVLVLSETVLVLSETVLVLSETVLVLSETVLVLEIFVGSSTSIACG
jgi:hypothetical protein